MYDGPASARRAATYRDELLSSWLARVACRFGLTHQALAGWLADDGENFRRFSPSMIGVRPTNSLSSGAVVAVSIRISCGDYPCANGIRNARILGMCQGTGLGVCRDD